MKKAATPLMMEFPPLMVTTQRSPRLKASIQCYICEYKKENSTFAPSLDGPIPIPFTVAAEMCTDEADNIDERSYQQKIDRRPMIISALRLIYKNKKEEWFSKPFLTSPLGATEYWQRVLRRRAAIWREAHNTAQTRAEAMQKTVSPVRSSVHSRLRMGKNLKRDLGRAQRALPPLAPMMQESCRPLSSPLSQNTLTRPLTHLTIARSTRSLKKWRLTHTRARRSIVLPTWQKQFVMSMNRGGTHPL